MQYETLREEISNCTRYSNEFSTFSMTALAAVLAFAFSSDNPFLFLVPFVLIIPLSSKSLYYRKNISKISAYMIVMLEPGIEGYLWETLVEKYKEDKKYSIFTIWGCGRFSGRPRRPAPAASCGRLSYRTPCALPRRTPSASPPGTSGSTRRARRRTARRRPRASPSRGRTRP